MEIIVHYPESPEKQKEFRKLAAKIHAEYVFRYICGLPCPTEQKLRLLDAAAAVTLKKSG